MASKGKRIAAEGENLAAWRKLIAENWYELEQRLRENSADDTKVLLEVRVEGVWNGQSERWNRCRVVLVHQKGHHSESWYFLTNWRNHWHEVSWMLSRWRFHGSGSADFVVRKEQALSGM